MITGGAGFVGLNLAEALLARGEQVVVFGPDRVPPPAAAAFARLPGRLVDVAGDARDAAAVLAAMRAHGVTRLFPLAAITAGVAREFAEPETVLEVNLGALVASLRAARAAGVRRVVHPSSTAVYGEAFRRFPRMVEDETPALPATLYGITKYAGERMALRLGALWGLDVVSARIGAVFGPWERDTGLRDTLSPWLGLARAAVAGRSVTMAGTFPAYSWLYARDAADGLVRLLDLAEPRERVFNLCSAADWSGALPCFAARLAERYPGFAVRVADDPEIRPNDPLPRATLDLSRISAATGYAPRFLADAAIADYLDWIEAHRGALGG